MYRIGQAKDIHQLQEGRKLVIGLQNIPFEKGCVAHSDGDVLVHAICESIIGALGLGDMGKLFPDTDDKYLDISSSYFLGEMRKHLEVEGYEIVNIDSTVILEKPMLQKYIRKMKEDIARVLDIDSKLINIKATRGEGLGYVGTAQGLEALSVVLLKKKI